MKDYGTIAIFRNEKKQAGSKHPDYNGKITITETLQPGEYSAGIYINESKKTGKKYQFGRIQDVWKKEEKPALNVKEMVKEERAKHDAESSFNDDLNDDVPF